MHHIFILQMSSRGRGRRSRAGTRASGGTFSRSGRKITRKVPYSEAVEVEDQGPDNTNIDVTSQAFKDAVASAVRQAVPAIVEQVKSLDRSQSEEETMINSVVDDHLQQLVATQPHPIPAEVSQPRPQPILTAPLATGEPGFMHISTHTPDIESGIPLDYHLAQKTKELITSHAYVEFSTLLKKDKEDARPKSFALKIQNDQFLVEGQSEPPTSQSINLWVSQFAIYSTVMLRAHPEQAIPLFHYLEHIRSLNTTGYDWSKYDQAFRKLHASNPNLYPFDRDLVVLQLKCQTKNPSVDSYKKQESKRPSNFQSPQYKKKERIEPPFPFGTCWTFQRGEYCSGCEWKEGHKCCYCGGKHAGSRCSQRPYSTESQTLDTRSRQQARDPDAEPRLPKPKQTRTKSQ